MGTPVLRKAEEFEPSVEAAKTLLDGIPSLSARDVLHVAVMKRRGVGRVLSFHAGFDAVPGLERLA